MASRLLIFDVKDLKDLLVHYTDGKLIPLDSDVAEVAVSRFVQRIISLNIESKDWPTHDVNPVTGELAPAEFIYEGKKTFSWTKSDGDEARWIDAPDSPR